VLEIVDERTGERWRLTRQDAMRLRDYIDQMYGRGQRAPTRRQSVCRDRRIGLRRS
jgi:hypothetical protein